MDDMDVDDDATDARIATVAVQLPIPFFVPSQANFNAAQAQPGAKFNGVWTERRFNVVNGWAFVDLSHIESLIRESKTLDELLTKCTDRALFSRQLHASTWYNYIKEKVRGQVDLHFIGCAVISAKIAIETLSVIVSRENERNAPRVADLVAPGPLRIRGDSCDRLLELLRGAQNLQPSPTIPDIRRLETVSFSKDISNAIARGNDSHYLKTSTARWINAARRIMPAITHGFVEGFSRRVWPWMRLLLPLQEQFERVCWLLAWRHTWTDKTKVAWDAEEAAAASNPIMEFNDDDMKEHVRRFQRSSTHRETVIVAALLSLASLGIGYKVDRARRTRSMFRLPMQHQRETFREVISNSPMRSPIHAYAILRSVVALNAVTRIEPGTYSDEHTMPPEPLFDFGVFLLSRWYTELYGILVTALTSDRNAPEAKTNDEWGRLCASLTLQWIPQATWKCASGALCPILPEHIQSVLAAVNSGQTTANNLFFDDYGNPNPHLALFRGLHVTRVDGDDVDMLFLPTQGANILPDINLVAQNMSTIEVKDAIEFHVRGMLAETTNAAILLLDWIQAFVGETSGKNAGARRVGDTWLLNKPQTTAAPVVNPETENKCRVCGTVLGTALTLDPFAIPVLGPEQKEADRTVSQERAHYGSMLDIAFERFVSGVRRVAMDQGTIERGAALDVCAGVHSVLASYVKCKRCIVDNLVPTQASVTRPKFAMQRIFREGASNVFPLLPRERLNGSGTVISRAYGRFN